MITQTFTMDTSHRNKSNPSPDVTVEVTPDGSVGMAIHPDGDELQYMSVNQAKSIAYAILALIGDSN